MNSRSHSWSRTLRVLIMFVITGGAVQAVAMELSSTQIALLLHDDPPGRGAVAAIASALTKEFGFPSELVVELGGRVATKSNVRAALNTLVNRANRADRPVGTADAFVLVSLPTRAEGPSIFFRASDDVASEPWTWIPRDEVLDWITQLPLRSALIVHRACVDTGEFPPPPPPTPRRAGRPVPVWMLTYCARELDEKHPTKGDDGRGVVAQAFYDVLRETKADRGAAAVNVPTLMARMRSLLPKVRLWLQEPAGTSSAPFAFVRSSPTVVEPPRRAAPMRSEEDWRTMLQALVLSANKQVSAAISRLAATSAAKVARHPDTSPGARKLAMDALAEMRGDAATDELGQIALDVSLDEELRRAAVGELLRKRDVTTIRKLLGEANPRIREAALRGSGILCDASSADAWAEATGPGNDPGVRIAAIQNLATLGRDVDRDLLTAVMLDQNADTAIRSEAITALGRLTPTPETTKVVVAMLREGKDPQMRRASAYALGKVPVGDPSRGAVESALAEAIAIGPDRVSQAAAFTAGELRAEQTIRSLISVVRDEAQTERARVAAAEALAKIGHPDAIPGLVEACQAKIPGVRRAAVTALGVLGRGEVLPALADRLTDPDAYVREEAARVITSLQAVDHAQILERIHDPSPLVRSTMVQRLVIVNDRDRDAVIELLDDESPVVQAAAIEQLAKQTDDHNIELIARALGSDRSRQSEGAAMALGRIGTPRALTTLLHEARSPEANRRRNALLALAVHADPAVADVLRQAGSDPDPRVRQTAAEALSWTSVEASRSEQLKKLATDQVPAVKQSAIDGLRKNEQQDWRSSDENDLRRGR